MVILVDPIVALIVGIAIFLGVSWLVARSFYGDFDDPD
jgi:hypothetical protein